MCGACRLRILKTHAKDRKTQLVFRRSPLSGYSVWIGGMEAGWVLSPHDLRCTCGENGG